PRLRLSSPSSPTLSPAGLTRGSIFFARSMDCRVISAFTRVHSPRRRASTPLRTRYARERHRDDRCKTAALFLLGVLRHGDAVRVDADGATHEPGSGGKICWCRRADSNRQPIAYEAL